MRNAGSFHGGTFGHVAVRAREALRCGAKWMVDVTRGLYREPEPTSLSETAVTTTVGIISNGTVAGTTSHRMRKMTGK